jgi:hypothetical protein
VCNIACARAHILDTRQMDIYSKVLDQAVPTHQLDEAGPLHQDGLMQRALLPARQCTKMYVKRCINQVRHTSQEKTYRKDVGQLGRRRLEFTYTYDRIHTYNPKTYIYR